MDERLLNQKLEKVKAIDAAITDPLFFSSLYSLVDEKSKNIFQNALVDTSHQLDLSEIQPSPNFRNRYLAKQTAKALFDEKGKFIVDKFPTMIQALEKHLYLIGPNCTDDAARREHVLDCLKRLQSDRELREKIEGIRLPVSNRVAVKMIRDSLDIEEKEGIKDRHARICVTSAFFTFLRQSVGSCFATAPAINIQRYEPHQFVKDLDDLITYGQLKRVVGGEEFAIPLSHSYGVGDLKRQVFCEEGKLSSPIWTLPSLHDALERLGHLKKDDSFQKKGEWIRSKLTVEKGLYSVEDLVKNILMNLYKVTEKDLEKEKEKPKPMMALSGVAPPEKEGKDTKGILAFQKAFSFTKSIILNFVDHPLLKGWEYTLASFSESYTQFTSWNLYSSLGLDASDPGGIGEAIYNAIEKRYDQAKLDKDHYSGEYDAIYLQVKNTESKMRMARSQEEADQLKREHQRRVQEMNYRLELREKAQRRLEKLANLFNYLIKIFYDKFKVYFQEVYDAEMHDVQGSIYDDSPAGFRLLYKFGRANPSQWEFVREPWQYQQYLAQFFKSVDFELGNMEELSDLQDDLTPILSDVIGIVQTDDFLISSLYRMGKAHGISIPKDPLNNLDKIQKKPWVYTSGGSMDNLVGIYYQREGKPTQRTRYVEDPKELLSFCLDSVKILDEKERQRYLQNPDLGLLMFSPTHAFRLLPGLKPFSDGWQDEGYAYTWIMEMYEAPARSFLNQIIFDRDMTEFVVQRIAQKLPEAYRDRFRVREGVPAKLSLPRLRDFLLDLAEVGKGRSLFGKDFLNSFFYESFPLTPDNRVELALEKVFSSLPLSDQEKKLAAPLYLKLRKSRFYQPFLTATDLYSLISTLVLLVTESTTLPVNIKQIIVDEMRAREMAMPRPIIFADTNWTSDYFAFLLNPTNYEMDFWRVSKTGLRGSSMGMWRKWLDGTNQKPPWGIYYRPQEYRTEEIPLRS